jgi:hypothetical protein
MGRKFGDDDRGCRMIRGNSCSDNDNNMISRLFRRCVRQPDVVNGGGVDSWYNPMIDIFWL